MKAAVFGILAVFATAAIAADYRCSGDRLEKSGSTVGKYRESGSDYYFEKAGSTLGKASKSGSTYRIEIGGSTVATVNGKRIEKGGSSWSTVDEARREFDCPDIVAAGFWVLKKNGKF